MQECIAISINDFVYLSSASQLSGTVIVLISHCLNFGADVVCLENKLQACVLTLRHCPRNHSGQGSVLAKVNRASAHSQDALTI